MDREKLGIGHHQNENIRIGSGLRNMIRTSLIECVLTVSFYCLSNRGEAAIQRIFDISPSPNPNRPTRTSLNLCVRIQHLVDKSRQGDRVNKWMIKV